jgi:OOP family OmpA-OmpF porin
VNKSKSTVAILSFAAATAFAGSALAQGATQETGAYAGLSIGQTKGTCTGTAAGASCDDSDMAWKIFGGYQFMRFLGAEIAYTDLGKVKSSASATAFGLTASSSAETKLNAWEIVAVGSYPIGTSGFAPYAKLGFYRGEAKTSSSTSVTGLPTVSTSSKETQNDFTGGLGVRYDITRNFAVRAEWQRYNGDADLDVYSIGAMYKF